MAVCGMVLLTSTYRVTTYFSCGARRCCVALSSVNQRRAYGAWRGGGAPRAVAQAENIKWRVERLCSISTLKQ